MHDGDHGPTAPAPGAPAVPKQAPAPDGARPEPVAPAGGRASRSRATRYLAAGAYLDVRYRDAVIAELVEHSERAVAPSFGVDLVPVLAHALRARSAETRTALVLLALLALHLALAVYAGAAPAAGALLLAGLLGWLAQWASGWSSTLYAPVPEPGRERAFLGGTGLGGTGLGGTALGGAALGVRAARAVPALRLLAAVALLAWAFLAVSVTGDQVERLRAYRDAVRVTDVDESGRQVVVEGLYYNEETGELFAGPSYREDGEHSYYAEDDLSGSPLLPAAAHGLSLATLVPLGLVLALHRRGTRRVLREELAEEPFRRRQMPGAVRWPTSGREVLLRHDELLRLIAREQHAATILYHERQPFAGAGEQWRPWSFVQELVRRPGAAKEAKGPADRPAAEPKPMTNEVLVENIRRHVQRLAAGGPQAAVVGHGDRLRALSVSDCVFLPAWQRPDSPLVGRRMEWTDELYARTLTAARSVSDEYARHFLCVTMGAWEEEVVTTVFVRAHTQGEMLVLEVLPHVLPPVRRRFRLVDAAEHLPLGGAWREAAAVVLDAPSAALRSLAVLGRHLASNLRARSNAEQARIGSLDVGPVVSVRELGAEGEMTLFQELDVTRFVKTVQDRITHGVRVSLREAGYRTDELEMHQTVINNSGVYLGGSNRGVISTGGGARVEQHLTAPPPGERGDDDD
ncbi:hypothetical protein [Allostreptomyces psammosilenae]|uniref:Uncharacterized protein n=1 Tax=Allostreptomyces psammosilenae TaxID=1892865 RepID=A0A853A1G9_9ACTN|nr:hypothetical protein [Allostreptomyces psammosilenae]NYI07987.1 hypothetical protein [Allostreptomyces psammosilenae]